MKNILFIAVLFLSASSNAQNLSLDEALSLRKKGIASVEEYLTNKGWDLISAQEPVESKLGTMTFAYKKSEYDDKAQSFLNYYYSPITGRKRLNIQINKKENYNLYLSKLKTLGVRIITSKIKDGEIYKTYQGPTTTIQVVVATQSEYSSTKTTYSFFILDNEDYVINFSGEE